MGKLKCPALIAGNATLFIRLVSASCSADCTAWVSLLCPATGLPMCKEQTLKQEHFNTGSSTDFEKLVQNAFYSKSPDGDTMNKQ